MTTPTNPTHRSWSSTLGFAGLLAILLAIVQAWGWRFDPPSWVPNGIYSRDFWAEGAFKAQEARRWALFGEWSTNDADNYRFWLIQSPAHVVPLAWWLKAFGVTWSNLRLYSVLTFAIGWVALFATSVRTRRDGAASMIAFACLGDFYLRHASRSALLEIPLTSWSCVAFLVALVSLRQPRWLLALPVISTAAFLTKQSGLILVPFSLFVLWWVGRRHKANPEMRRILGLWAAIAMVLTVGLVFYITQDSYWRTLEWNADHMVGSDRDRGAPLKVQYANPLPILERLLDPDRWLHVFLYNLPIALPGAVLHLGLITYRWGRHKRRPDDDDLFAGLLFVLTLAALQATHQDRLRFVLMLFPWSWWLTGRALASMWKTHRWVGVVSIIATLTVGASTHGQWNLTHYRSERTELFDNNAHLATLLTSEDRLIGKMAPWMAFDTPADHYVFRLPFNCNPRRIRALNPTHLLRDTKKEYTRYCIRKVRRAWLQGADPLTEIPWQGRKAYLLSLPSFVEPAADTLDEDHEDDDKDDSADSSEDEDKDESREEMGNL